MSHGTIIHPERRAFYALMYDRPGPGYVEVVAGQCTQDNPNLIELLILTRDNFDRCKHDPRYKNRTNRFIWVDAQQQETLEKLDAEVERLTQEFGNVYVSASTYATQSRGTPQGGRVVWIEDAPYPEDPRVPVPYSFYVRTGTGPGHGYYVLDHDVSPSEREYAARTLAAALGSDRSGSDSQQLVRVPGSNNTKAKHGGTFPVQMILHAPQRTYRLADLLAAYGSALPDCDSYLPENQSDKKQWKFPDPAFWEKADRWSDDVHHPGGVLITEDNIPRRFKNDSEAKNLGLKILRTHQRGGHTFYNEKGHWDASRERYHVIKALVLRGCPDDEIGAIAYHLAAFAEDIKGENNIKIDIERCISKIRDRHPDVQVCPARTKCHSATDPNAKEHQSQDFSTPDKLEKKKQRGRPKTTLSPEEYLAWLGKHISVGNHVLFSQRDIATQLKVSEATIRRLEKKLQAQKRIVRTLSPDRHVGMVTIMGASKFVADENIDAPKNTNIGRNFDAPMHGMATPETAHCDSQCKERARAFMESTPPQCIGEELAVLEEDAEENPAMVPERLPLAQLVFEAVISMPRASFPHLMRYASERGYDVEEDVLRKMYDAARIRKQRDAETAAIRSMEWIHLMNAIRNAESHIEEGIAPGADEAMQKQLPFWQRRHCLLCEERDRRLDKAPGGKRKVNNQW
jgi:hypothetical protein